MNQPIGLVIFSSFLLLSAASSAAPSGETDVSVAHFYDFARFDRVDGVPAGWSTWAPRREVSPKFSVDVKAGRSGHGALRIDGEADHAAAFGGWRRRIDGLVGGKTYRFVAWFRTKNVPYERRSVIARLEWLDAQGKAVRPPDYAIDMAQEGRWTRMEYLTPVPEATQRLDVALCLGFAAGATVWWDDIELWQVPNPPDRIVRVVTIHHRPSGSRSAAESVGAFCQMIEKAADLKPDVICLPEGITVVGTGKSYAEVSESVPGPTTAKLGGLAHRLNCYIVAGLYERVGPLVFNTAVLLGRKGEVVGKYRKTHLPREEWEEGVAAGNGYPVFNTDFGKVGLMVCWDLQFPEVARAMATQGAEILFLPIWGGNETLAKARAIENCVYLVTSTYDMRTFILDPIGQVLAEGTKEAPIAAAELHLDRRYDQPWLGDMKTRTWKERRMDLPMP